LLVPADLRTHIFLKKFFLGDSFILPFKPFIYCPKEAGPCCKGDDVQNPTVAVAQCGYQAHGGNEESKNKMDDHFHNSTFK
jgi:hypothetical protein